MQTPNITNPKFTTKVSGSFHYGLSFPLLSYGKKYYLIKNDVLTACIPLYSILLKDFSEKEPSYGVWTCMKIAGEKGPTMLYNTLKLFSSIEQYNANQSFIQIPTIRVDECFAKHNFGIRNSGCWNRVVFGWTATKGGTTINDNNVFSFDKVWYDEDGFHFIESAENKENKIFKFQGDAINSARITKVIDFDDEEDKNNKMFEFRILDINIKLCAESKEQAEYNVNSIIKNAFGIND